MVGRTPLSDDESDVIAIGAVEIMVYLKTLFCKFYLFFVNYTYFKGKYVNFTLNEKELFNLIKQKSSVLKSIFVFLSMLLFFSSFMPTLASAHEANISEENAVEILEALDQSAIPQADGTVLFNEKILEDKLKGNSGYEEVVLELEHMGLLTDKEFANVPMMAQTYSGALNPKWVEARDKCARNYLADHFGSEVVTGILTFLYAGKYYDAVKKLLKLGIKISPAGLAALYTQMNYVCIKEANSKHSVYE